MVLYDAGVEVVVHPMDLALGGRKGPLSRARAAIARELTFTRANQTWTVQAQEIEDALARAARSDGDLDAIAARLAKVELGYDQWEILYRLLLQVRLRTSPLETDALVPLEEPIPPIGRRFSSSSSSSVIFSAARGKAPLRAPTACGFATASGSAGTRPVATSSMLT